MIATIRKIGATAIARLQARRKKNIPAIQIVHCIALESSPAMLALFRN